MNIYLSKRHRIVHGLAAFLLCGLSLIAAASEVPEVNISHIPLFSGRANVHPNMLLSLSVEFPTVGVAYRGNDGTYDRTIEYTGYFNPNKCYLYSGSNRNPEEDAAGLYFHIGSDADASHECDGQAFSGNFMNWASSSAIDMLRYALTGGDRVVDTPSETILQRAFLRDSGAGNFYANSTYFPRRKIVAGGNVSAPDRVTPFKVDTLYVVSCRNRILFSDANSGVSGDKGSEYCTSKWDGTGKLPSNAVDKKLGEYLVRVKVCDSAEAEQRKDLCTRYESGYKPEGEIQRHADKLRVGAMGYLLDDSAERYGGVLRAPVKYVGPKKITVPDFVAADNDRLEWNPKTGVFYHNPDDPAARDGAANSGVINYLNKFGRSGVYKGYDPVGELYYEGIRYFQGKEPTPAATTGMTDAMKDGFPVIEEWEDPVIASCQRNYIVTIADVNTHWDRYIPGNTRTTFGTGEDAHDTARAADTEVSGKTPALDVGAWTKKVGDMESDAGGTYTNPSKNGNLAGLESKDTGSGKHGTYYMAGLAYWANTHDIRLDKATRVKTFAIDVDEGGNGQIDGNSRSLQPRDSQLYLAAKYGGFEVKTDDNNPFITLSPTGVKVDGSYAPWSEGSDATAVPSNYFLAGQPKKMIQSIRKVFATIGSESGTISGVAVSTSKTSTDGAYIYQPGFDSSKWGGSLKKLKLTVDDDGQIHIAKKPEWDAGIVLTGSGESPASPAADARKIFTSTYDAEGSMSTIEFKWDALSDAQKSALNKSPADGAADDLGEKRLDFLRGKRDLESSQKDGIFRVRERVLGDIVNSNLVYVGAPSGNGRGKAYQDFYDAKKNRVKTVYVGANDGMLHAFDTNDGKELFAYVPGALFANLNRLTSTSYTHQAYADGSIVVAEALVNGSWKSVLASGLGGGAQGVFALDVSNPAGFASGSGAIFEFTDADDADMGNVMGPPVIAKFRTGSKDGAPLYKYFIVVCSGLNNYRDDGEGRFNADGAGALFLLSLDKPSSSKWKEGVNYFKFRTPNTDATMQNGLSPPGLVLNADGAVRYAYAGDLQGNLWRFDFNGAAPWENALSGSKPLFVAKGPKNARQPITVQPRVVFAPGGGFVVLFGTGKFVEDVDTASGSFSAQSFYGILDTVKAGYTVSGRDDLTPRSLTASGNAFQISGDAVPYGSEDGGGKGWYFDFLNAAKTGERSVANPLVSNGLLFFNTLIPGSDPCAAGGGRSYVLNTLTGLPAGNASNESDRKTGYLSVVGMLSAPVPFETSSEVSDRNAIGRRAIRKKFTIVNFGTGGSSQDGSAASGESADLAVPAGRFSWREIINWQELRNALSKK